MRPIAVFNINYSRCALRLPTRATPRDESEALVALALRLIAVTYANESLVADDLGGTSPLQLLQDDFESSDQEIRLKALKRVKLVADVLGPEVTRSELIPFINSENSSHVLVTMYARVDGSILCASCSWLCATWKHRLWPVASTVIDACTTSDL